MMSRKSGKNVIVGREIFRMYKISGSSKCNFCNEENTKYKTDQGIVACGNCFAEDPNHVPFYEECDFLRTAHKARAGAYGAVKGNRAFLENENLELMESEEEEESDKEEKLRKKIINSKFLNDEEKQFKLKNIHRLKKSLVEAEYEQREAKKREEKRKILEILQAEYREEKQWEREILEEEARRAKRAQQAQAPKKPRKPRKPKVNQSEESDCEDREDVSDSESSENDCEDVSDCEDSEDED